MDAYCEHLGTHLGYGGRVEDERIVCPFHGWEWNAEGRNVCIPYENRPNPGRRIRSYPVVERNESIYIWHDVHSRAPYFDVPDVFTGFGDGATAADYYPAYGRFTLHRERLELHPQYVLENGVDFAHFEYVHKVPITPKFTRQDFDAPVSYVDFTITFAAGDGVSSIDDVTSGVNAINGGLDVAVTKGWGMVDNRTASAVTPVDDTTCDVRFSVWVARLPGDNGAEQPTKANQTARAVIEQFEADIHIWIWIWIWRHQRYSDPPPWRAPNTRVSRPCAPRPPSSTPRAGRPIGRCGPPNTEPPHRPSVPATRPAVPPLYRRARQQKDENR